MRGSGGHYQSLHDRQERGDIPGSKNFVWVGVVHEDLEVDGPYRYLNSDIVVTHRKEIGEGGPTRRDLEIPGELLQEECPGTSGRHLQLRV